MVKESKKSSKKIKKKASRSLKKASRSLKKASRSIKNNTKKISRSLSPSSKSSTLSSSSKSLNLTLSPSSKSSTLSPSSRLSTLTLSPSSRLSTLTLSPSSRLSTLTLSPSSQRSSRRSSQMEIVDTIEETIPMEVDPEYKPGHFEYDSRFKGITISFVIFGHGAVINLIDNKKKTLQTFENPKNVKQTNVSGLRFSGINHLVNRDYEKYIESFLLKNQNRNMNELFRGLNEIFFKFLPDHPDIKKRVEEIQTTKKIGNDFFGTKEKYSIKNAQKFYFGANKDDVKYHRRHPELTKKGPLVKIYSIIRNDIELLSHGETVTIFTNNNITLTQIINNVTQYVLNSGMIPIMEKDDFSRENNFIINVLDLTCNSTENYPLIGFIE